MKIFNAWDIVVVPFPFVDSPHSKNRPAIVLSNHNFNRSHSHSILMMITTATSTSWPSDTSLPDNQTTGLPTPSVARAKLFTLTNQIIRRKIGTVPSKSKIEIAQQLQSSLNLK